MRMPGLDGTQLHLALRDMGRQLPVIYLSGQSSLQQGIVARKLGAHEFLIKPVARQALLSAVASGLEKSRDRCSRCCKAPVWNSRPRT